MCEEAECAVSYEYVDVAGMFVPRCVHLQFSETETVTVDDYGIFLAQRISGRKGNPLQAITLCM